jgi:hypothetical protein
MRAERHPQLEDQLQAVVGPTLAPTGQRERLNRWATWAQIISPKDFDDSAIPPAHRQ